MTKKICEFEIKIDDDNNITAARNPKEEGEIPDCKIEPNELRDLTIEVLIQLLRENRLRETKEFQILGSHLYTVLLNNSIGEALNEALVDPKKSYDLIKVELIFGPKQEQLASWRWEYLYCPKSYGKGASGYFLASKSRLLLSRRIPIDIPMRKIPITQDELPLKILFVAAGPKYGLQESEYEELKVRPVEYEKLLEELKELEKESEGRIKLYELVETSKENEDYKVTFTEFKQLVSNLEPHVIHFVGHGECKENRGGSLLFMDEYGAPQWVEDEDFANLISEIFPVRLVFLQACESALADPYQAISGVAMNLAHNNVTAVVAMQYRIEQLVAIKFAQSFYKALANSEAIDKAVQTGRDKIWSDISKLARRKAFGLPVLYLRKSGALIKMPEIVKESIVEQGRQATISESGQKESIAGTPHPIKEELPKTQYKDPGPSSDRADSNKKISPVIRDSHSCPWCDTINYSPGQLSCDNCGGDIRCPECHTEVPRKGHFCSNPECRHRLTGPSREIQEEEKRKMSLLYVRSGKKEA